MDTRLIIDGDIFLYQQAFAAETEICWDEENELWTLYGELPQARAGFEESISKVQEVTGIKDYIVCFTGKKVFRLDLLPEYKVNRSGKRKPVLINPLRDYIRDKHPSMTVPHLEADDLLGCLAGPRDIMVSSDKDLQTVPGMHFNPNDPLRGVEQIVPLEAAYNHFIQTLTGDSVDNFKGCPGVGAVTARKLVPAGPPREMWNSVVEAFAKKGLDESHALTQARMAYILRGNDYNFTTNEITHWTPENYSEQDRSV